MKPNLISILLFSILIMSVVKAQRMFKLNKPVVDLNARPQVTTTPKLPEERRKLSVFPKSMTKFVVSSKPYSKVRTYSPWEISTKKPIMQKMLPNEAKTSKMVPVTRPTLMKFSYQPPVQENSREVYGVEDLGTSQNQKAMLKEEIPHVIYPQGKENIARLSKIGSQFVSRNFEAEAESTDAVPNISSVENGETKKDFPDMFEQDNNRPKRLSLNGFSVYNHIDASSKSDSEEERKDDSEFIFLKDKIKSTENKQNINNFGLDEDLEIATEVFWMEDIKPRSKRSVNIIEEENLGTTIAGFKFTGREPQVNSHLYFKNINA